MRSGLTFLLSAVGYAIIRFGLTYYRQETVIIWGLQEAQVIALATAVLVLAAWIIWGPRRPAAPAPA